jgi:hypothetical protein
VPVSRASPLGARAWGSLLLGVIVSPWRCFGDGGAEARDSAAAGVTTDVNRHIAREEPKHG